MELIAQVWLCGHPISGSSKAEGFMNCLQMHQVGVDSLPVRSSLDYSTACQTITLSVADALHIPFLRSLSELQNQCMRRRDYTGHLLEVDWIQIAGNLGCILQPWQPINQFQTSPIYHHPRPILWTNLIDNSRLPCSLEVIVHCKPGSLITMRLTTSSWKRFLQIILFERMVVWHTAPTADIQTTESVQRH